MKILKTMQKIPGGVLIVPLILGMLINSFFPGALEIGSFTTALFKKATQPLLALFIFCAGSQIDIHKAGLSLAKGGALTVTKILIGAVVGLLIGRIYGNVGILGLSVLAIVPGMTNSNSSLFAALASQTGDDTDVGAVSVIALNNGPLFTMIILGSAGLANISAVSFVAVLVPILVGFALGNLDPDWREYLKHGKMLIPFLGFSIGASLDIKTIQAAGASGILLGFATLILTGFGGYFIYGIFKGSRRAVGAAIGTTAGIAAATPAAIAAVDPSMNPFVQTATVQISASIIITALLCPVLVSLLNNLEKKKKSSAKTVDSVPAKGSTP